MKAVRERNLMMPGGVRAWDYALEWNTARIERAASQGADRKLNRLTSRALLALTGINLSSSIQSPARAVSFALHVAAWENPTAQRLTLPRIKVNRIITMERLLFPAHQHGTLRKMFALSPTPGAHLYKRGKSPIHFRPSIVPAASDVTWFSKAAISLVLVSYILHDGVRWSDG